jgi:actin-related protein
MSTWSGARSLFQSRSTTRQNIAETLFEAFRVPSTYLGIVPTLALFTSCKTGGVAIDCGDSFSQVSSVFEWTQMPQNLLRTEPLHPEGLEGHELSLHWSNMSTGRIDH